MTNSISIWLGVSIVAALTLDALAFDWANSVFLGRKLLELTEYLAFWR